MPLPKAMPRDVRQVPAQQEDPDAARVINRWGRWKRTINQDSLDKSVRRGPDYCDFFREHQLVFCVDADPIGWGVFRYKSETVLLDSAMLHGRISIRRRTTPMELQRFLARR